MIARIVVEEKPLLSLDTFATEDKRWSFVQGGLMSREFYYFISDPCTYILTNSIRTAKEKLSYAAKKEMAKRRAERRQLAQLDREAKK